MLAFLSKVWYSSTYGIQMYIEGVQNMDNSSELIIVDKKVLPEVFTKVLQVKELLNSGGITSVQEAVDKVGVSRSAYYKYKDHVMEYNPRISNNIITLYMTMEDIPGVLSSVINHLAEYGANILTINQNIPSDGVAAVTVSLRMTDVTLEEEQLMKRLRELHGVVRVSKVS